MLGKKCIILVNDVDNGVGYACAGGIAALENLYLHLNFFANLKLLLKKTCLYIYR